jgi:hypothetical protein
MTLRLAVIVMSLLPVTMIGCNVDLGEVPFYCCQDCNPKCPDGYECKGNFCVKNGSCPDFVPGCKTAVVCNNNGTCDAGEDQSNCPADCTTTTGSCGDGKCEPSESCTSCEADCGKCPNNCGNGTCDAGETPQSCPADCGGTQPQCGNGKCETGETAASCPADCKSATCTQDETKCDGTDKIQFCDQGAWTTETCETVCTNGGQYDYSAGCEYSSDKMKDLCLCGTYGNLGDLCNEKLKCDPTLFCGSFDATKPGFCTKNCTVPDSTCYGGPSGTTAKCILQVQGQYACGFTCYSSLSCPSGMTCDTINGLCKPQ